MSNKLTEEQVQKILHGIHVPPQPQILVDLFNWLDILREIFRNYYILEV